MEIRKRNVTISRKEMQEIKRMDHRQMEGKIQEAYNAGFRDRDKNWRRAVESTLEETKGIGPGRKELILERLDRKIRGQQDPEKSQ